MRQRLGIIVTIVLAIAVLVAINSAAYVTEEEKQDSELKPNRSTYNAGATGTRALYDFLNESGYKVMRWREPPERCWAPAVKRCGPLSLSAGRAFPLTRKKRRACCCGSSVVGGWCSSIAGPKIICCRARANGRSPLSF